MIEPGSAPNGDGAPDPDEAAGANDKCVDREEYWRQRLALPVVLAALLSLPAVFLTTSSDPALAYTGHVLNGISLAVLVAESVLLFALSENRRAWVQRYRWHLTITAVAIPAVFFTLFPAQAMRLLQLARLLATLRVKRATRLVRASRALATRFGLTGVHRNLVIALGVTLAVVFAAVVLADPVAQRRHRTVLDQIVDAWLPLPPVALIALALSAAVCAVVITVRYRRSRRGRRPRDDENE